jgi:demethylmenaquinone methyltransferase/2-methoxy-6-polyprenyl-1,4-benzoquinol methylase
MGNERGERAGTVDESRLLQEQVDYYRARAGEYDEWFLRVGRYDRGPEHRAQWNAEAATVRAALNEALSGGAATVLELACGTGLWTEHLAAHAVEMVAVDASPEVIAINRDRVKADHVSYVLADLFAWQPDRKFEFIFFSFWLSHVPLSRRDAFWNTVQAALAPGGRVFFVDSLLDQASTAVDHDALDQSGVARRRLNDGREFSVVKVFDTPERLHFELSNRGWHGWVRSTPQFFIYGLVDRNLTF